MTDVSVVVVTYNGLPWVEQALASVVGHETIVVDNGSSDDTVSFVRERFPEVELVEEENLGLAHGWNTGVARTSGRYVLLLNADAWLDPGALDALVEFADAGQAMYLLHHRPGFTAPPAAGGTIHRSALRPNGHGPTTKLTVC